MTEILSKLIKHHLYEQQLLKNLKSTMSDIFDIIPHSDQSKGNSNLYYSTSNYIKLQGDFLTNNLGYYSFRFIQMISKDASHYFSSIQVLSLNKILRQITKKYMLSDLELVYVAHIANLMEWNFEDSFVKTHFKLFDHSSEGLNVSSLHLLFFTNLVAYFVKKYIGQIQECKAISEILKKETNDKWEKIYEEWLTLCPPDIFQLSPRSINKIYSKYSKNCQTISTTKNYNKMVDQVMELSTTYAMIPGQTKENKKKKRDHKQRVDQELADTVNQDPFLFGRKILKVDEVHQGSMSKYLDLKNSSMLFNYGADSEIHEKKEKKVKLGLRGERQLKVNNNVTDFFKEKQRSDLSISKKINQRSMIGIVDPYPNFFDSKGFSSGEEIIPYNLRSNSHFFKSKLLE